MVRRPEMMPAVGRLQNVPRHGLAEPRLVLLGARHRGPVAAAAREAAVLDPRLEPLVPCVGADAVDDADDKLLAAFVDGDHERVVHYVLAREEERVVPNLYVRFR